MSSSSTSSNSGLTTSRVCSCCGPRATSNGVSWYGPCASPSYSSVHSENLEPQDVSRQVGKRPEQPHNAYMSTPAMAVPGGGRGQGQEQGYSSVASSGGGMNYPTTQQYGTFTSQATIAEASNRVPGDTSSSSDAGQSVGGGAQGYQSSSSSYRSGGTRGGSQGWQYSDSGSYNGSH